MILLVSNNDDWSTNDVVEWLRAKGAPFKRLNFDTFATSSCEITFENGKTKTVVIQDGEEINSDEINIIWFRRSAKPVFANVRDINISKNYFNRRIFESIETESKYFYRAFFHSIGNNTKWLSHFESSYNDKISTLLLAQRFDIEIPVTFQTFSKKSAIQFIETHGDVIMKPIYNIEMFNVDGKMYMPYTKKVIKEDFNDFDEKIFPVVLQREVKKRYEIRSFYLDGYFYSMAIFSQESGQTEVDFRRYNYEKPNRRVPYNLPNLIERKLRSLMEALNLKSGSIDLLKSTDNRYIFLEVNPVGQFGMVSYPCNYYLEEKIADCLIQQND